MAARKPWERLPNEGAKPFEYFELYRNSGNNGNRPRPGEIADQVGKSRSLIHGYSSRFNWAERAEAWDSRVIAEQDKAVLSETAKMAKRHLKLSGTALAVAQTTLAAALQGSVGHVGCPHCGGKVKVPKFKATVREAAALMRDGVNIERLVTDQATSRNEDGSLDLSKLEAGEKATLLELLKKAGYEG
jgi:hypothetical protein